MTGEAARRAAEIEKLLLSLAPVVNGTAYGPSIRRDTALLIERAVPALVEYVTEAVRTHECVDYCWEPNHTTESGERERRLHCVQCTDAAMAKAVRAKRERINELEDVLEELLNWGTPELDDPRLPYVVVQVDRSTRDAAAAALRREEGRSDEP